LLESWKQMAEAHEAEMLKQHMELSNHAAEQYRNRLENVSNSWMVATVTTLDKHARDVMANIGTEAETNIRETCSQVFESLLNLGHGGFARQNSLITALTELWFFSALLAYFAVRTVHGVERVWRWLQNATAKKIVGPQSAAQSTPAPAETVADPGRRYFFRAATAAAGAAPFLGAMYGFAAERLNYQVRRVEIPLPNLPSALDGMQIVQISDIHLSSYMSRTQVRRAVDMANELGADLAVVTGDLITGSGDSIADCIDEIRHLHAPLGIWGCNGNHEIYARAEDEAAYLYAQAGMKLLRQENAQITFKGAPFNLIGVDYQRERTPRGQRQQTLARLQPLVRRDMINILLSHNPNTFNRAAELGVELSSPVIPTADRYRSKSSTIA